MMWLPLSVVLFACDEPDPMIGLTASYAGAVRPLLEQNEAIERRFLDIAGQMTQAPMAADQIATLLRDDVLTSSSALIEATAAVEPGSPTLAQLHAELEDAWRARDTAWRSVLSAYDDRDADKLAAAIETREDAREAEERYIFDVNAVIRPYGQRLTLYP